MNPSNYCTLPMAKRLHEAGVRMETEAVWAFIKKNEVNAGRINPDAGEWKLIKKPLFPYREQYPALSMSEAWEALPVKSYLYKGTFSNEAWLGRQDYSNKNATDCLCELLLWQKGEGK